MRMRWRAEIEATCRTIGALRKEVVDRKELSKTTKLRVYNAIVKPTLLYGCTYIRRSCKQQK